MNLTHGELHSLRGHPKVGGVQTLAQVLFTLVRAAKRTGLKPRVQAQQALSSVREE